jgi:predicted MFS family arabinose efflux permease
MRCAMPARLRFIFRRRRLPTAAAAQGAPSPPAIAFAGLIALAVAMGIGRFAFTPILPMMQQDAALSLGGGGWLASANYLGFLSGAVSATHLRIGPARVIRWSLVLIGVLTIGMGVTSEFAAWMVLRALAGVANAWAQVFALAWCLNRLAAVQRPRLNGVVCAGAGTGIVIAGGFCLVLMHVNANSEQAWVGLGMIALGLTAAVWPTFSAAANGAPGKCQQPPPRGRWDADWLLLVLCFGASGLGYIVPATFLPVMARQRVADPWVFGWSWPIFGAAAAVSPLLVAGWALPVGNRRVWALSHLVMAFAVALPVFWPAIGGIMIAALLIGGTFMINALASMQEAHAVAGPNGSTRLIAAMIAAFGTGQIVGPLLLNYAGGPEADFSPALLIAAAALIASAYTLSRSHNAGSARVGHNKLDNLS